MLGATNAFFFASCRRRCVRGLFLHALALAQNTLAFHQKKFFVFYGFCQVLCEVSSVEVSLRPPWSQVDVRLKSAIEASLKSARGQLEVWGRPQGDVSFRSASALRHSKVSFRPPWSHLESGWRSQPETTLMSGWGHLEMDSEVTLMSAWRQLKVSLRSGYGHLLKPLWCHVLWHHPGDTWRWARGVDVSKIVMIGWLSLHRSTSLTIWLSLSPWTWLFMGFLVTFLMDRAMHISCILLMAVSFARGSLGLRAKPGLPHGTLPVTKPAAELRDH